MKPKQELDLQNDERLLNNNDLRRSIQIKIKGSNNTDTGNNNDIKYNLNNNNSPPKEIDVSSRSTIPDDDDWLSVTASLNRELSYHVISSNTLQELGLNLNDNKHIIKPWPFATHGLLFLQLAATDKKKELYPIGLLKSLQVQVSIGQEQSITTTTIENIAIISSSNKIKLPADFLIFGKHAPQSILNCPAFELTDKELEEERAKEIRDRATPAFLRWPDEVWLNIFSYIQPDQPSLKALRSVSPRLYQLVTNYKSFTSSSSFTFKKQPLTIFNTLSSYTKPNAKPKSNTSSSEPPPDWGSLSIELYYDQLTSPLTNIIPAPFLQKLNSVLSTLSLIHCCGAPPSFYLSSIVDACFYVKKLTIGMCPNFIPTTAPAQNSLIILPNVWPNIKSLTLINDSHLTMDIASEITSRLFQVNELSVIGLRWNIPTTKSELKSITPNHLEHWRSKATLLTSIFLPFIRRNSHVLKSLNVSYHPTLSETVFFTELLHYTQNYGLRLKTLQTDLCDLPIALLAKLFGQMTTLNSWSGSITGYKCRHEPTYSNQYYKLLSRKTLENITSFKLRHSKKFNCLCFLQQMTKLEILDISYNTGIYCKYLRLKDRGCGLTSLTCVGNNSLGLVINELLLWNVEQLDLSFSNAVRTTTHFNHICEHMKKLKVLKLSGSAGDWDLSKLGKLRELKELRLRSCAELQAGQFQAHIALPLLEVLDLADTQLNYAGLVAIIAKNRLLRYLDVRSCPGLRPYHHTEQLNKYSYLSLIYGKLRKKRTPRLPEVVIHSSSQS